MFNAARLKKLRKDLGFTQQEMADELYIQQSTYSKLETNTYDINCRILEVLQEKFKVDPKEFLNNYSLTSSKMPREVHLPIAESSVRGDLEGFIHLIKETLQLHTESQQIIIQNQLAIMQVLDKKNQK